MEHANAKTDRAPSPASRPHLHAGDKQAVPATGACAASEGIAGTVGGVLSEHGLRVNSRRWDPEQFLGRRLVPSPDVQYTVLDDEAILLNLRNGHGYTLNRVGTIMWELMAGRTLAGVLDEICQRYEVHRDRAHDDLVALVMRLEAEGLARDEGG